MLYSVIEMEVFMASKNYFINGITELLILSILNCHDSYVYEIVKSIENFSEGLLTISQNTIYTATYKLENEGKITEYSKQVGKKRTRIYYRIEQSGREFLKEISQNYKNTTDGIQKIMNVLSQEQGGCKTDE